MFSKRSIQQKNVRKRPLGEDELNVNTSMKSKDGSDVDAIASAADFKEDHLYSGEPNATEEESILVDSRIAKNNSAKRRSHLKEAFSYSTKQTKQDEGTLNQQPLVTYESHRSLDLGNDQRATTQFSVNTEVSQDHRSILERNSEIGKQILSGELEEGIYRGKGAYKPIVNRREGAIAAGKYTGLYGPVRGSENIRMTMRIDLNPEICKDYKETGYCGFGDTCKFLHDRSDYKEGWKLEKEWEELQKKKQAKLRRLAEREGDEEDEEDVLDSEEDDSGDEKIPFACLLCKQKWSQGMHPVVTICKHYFCEQCAFRRYAKSSKCAVCNQQTSGIFNNAEEDIEKWLEKVG